MSETPRFLLAPGAGASSSSAWMASWRERLGALGEVRAFDYRYQREGRKSPDRMPALLAAHREALLAFASSGSGPLFLVGKSMGGRVGCHLVSEDAEAGRLVAGLVCLGYPLKAGATGALRDQVLLALRTPILFVQGTRDPLCPLDTLAAVRPLMTAANALRVVLGGDHSLVVSAAQRKAAGETQAEVDARVLAAIGEFTASVMANDGGGSRVG